MWLRVYNNIMNDTFSDFTPDLTNKLNTYNNYISGSVYKAIDLTQLPRRSSSSFDMEHSKPIELPQVAVNTAANTQAKNEAIAEVTERPSVPTTESVTTYDDFVKNVMNYTYIAPPKPKDEYVNSNTGETISLPAGTLRAGVDVPKDFNYAEFKKRLGANESTQNYTTLNMKTGDGGKVGSGAWGRYQHIWYWSGADIAKVTGITDPMKFLNSPQAQENFFDWNFKNTLVPGARRLKKKYPNVKWTDSQWYEAIHFQGEGGLDDRLAAGTTGAKDDPNNPTVDSRLTKVVSRSLLDMAPTSKPISQKQLALYNANKHLVVPRKNK